jgi:hypothetical protein
MSVQPHVAKPATDPAASALRSLEWLTVASLVFYLASVVSNYRVSQVPSTAFEGFPVGEPPAGAFVVGAVVGLIIVVGLYALVLVPLRRRHREAWFAGMILSTIGIIHGVLSAVVTPGAFWLGVPGLLLIVVNALWLYVAMRPGVRESLD